MELNLRLLGAVLAAASACAAAAAPYTQIGSAEQGRTWVRLLADTKRRDEAYCALLRLRLHHQRLPYRDECLPVSDVVAAPQATGSSLYPWGQGPGSAGGVAHVPAALRAAGRVGANRRRDAARIAAHKHSEAFDLRGRDTRLKP